MFLLPIDVTMEAVVDLDSFQSITVTDIRFTATPSVLDFPGFNGNVSLTVDELSLMFNGGETYDLNPASGGLFETPIIGNYGTNAPVGTVDLEGHWDNFSFHSDLESTLDSAVLIPGNLYSGDEIGLTKEGRIVIDPLNYPTSIDIITPYIDRRGSYDSVASAELTGVLLEPYYEWSLFFVQFPADEISGNGWWPKEYRLTFTPLTFQLGDADTDRDVDITDFNNLSANFDPTGANAPHPWEHGNFDDDNDVDITDFNFLAANFAPAGYATSAIPEPSTMLLVLLALILMGVSFRLSKNG